MRRIEERELNENVDSYLLAEDIEIALSNYGMSAHIDQKRLSNDYVIIDVVYKGKKSELIIKSK